MKETTERPEKRSVKDRRRGFERRDPESDVPRVPGQSDRRRAHERRHVLRREADRTATKPGSKPKSG